MRILTGSTGANHVTAADDGALYAGIIGSGSYVLDIGQKFAATVVNATTVKLADGDGVLQGRHFRTDPGETDTVTIEDGSLGTSRNDVIGVRYIKDAGVESMAWQVIKGTATTGTATDPTYSEGDVLGGESSAFMPMYRVKLSGANLSAIEPMFSVLTPARDHAMDKNNPHGVTFKQVVGADVLPVSKGGTGNTSGRAASAASADKAASADTATKLTNPRTIGVNLASGEAASFDGTSNVNPGVYGLLPLSKGGLGATTPDGACANIGALRMVQFDTGHTTKGGINDISAWIGYRNADGSTTYNQMDLGKESTWFKQPVSISSGGTGNTTGTAQSALKLAKSCSIGVNLASGEAASFNGTANVTPGVYGVLPKANGGTGNTSGRAASADTATKLSNRRAIGVNLASGNAAYFDGTADIQPGVLGVLPLANGGLGATTADGACANIGALRITRYSDNTNYSAGCGDSTMWFAYQQNGETKCQVDLWNGGALTVNGHIVYNNDNIKYSATEPEVWDGRIWLKPI